MRRRRRRHIHVGRLLFVIFLMLLIIATLCAGVIVGANYDTLFPKYDKEIMGSAYISSDMVVPTPEPTPTPTPGPNDRKAKFPGEFVEVFNAKEEKSAYLTFDDGPSPLTPKILDILKEEHVPATFFLLGQNISKYPDTVKREFEEGHTVANHSYSHDYKKLYKTTVDAFASEVQQCEEAIGQIIGSENVVKLFRFPGGSFESYKDPYKQWLSDQGYKYIDWNALNGDAEAPLVSVEKLISNVKRDTGKTQNVVILMHDAAAKTTTPEALPAIISYLRESGYTFKALGEEMDG